MICHVKGSGNPDTLSARPGLIVRGRPRPLVNPGQHTLVFSINVFRVLTPVFRDPGFSERTTLLKPELPLSR